MSGLWDCFASASECWAVCSPSASGCLQFKEVGLCLFPGIPWACGWAIVLATVHAPMLGSRVPAECRLGRAATGGRLGSPWPRPPVHAPVHTRVSHPLPPHPHCCSVLQRAAGAGEPDDFPVLRGSWHQKPEQEDSVRRLTAGSDSRQAACSCLDIHNHVLPHLLVKVTVCPLSKTSVAGQSLLRGCWSVFMLGGLQLATGVCIQRSARLHKGIEGCAARRGCGAFAGVSQGLKAVQVLPARGGGGERRDRQKEAGRRL